jgi:hypothetical protein
MDLWVRVLELDRFPQATLEWLETESISDQVFSKQEQILEGESHGIRLSNAAQF